MFLLLYQYNHLVHFIFIKFANETDTPDPQKPTY